MCLYRHAARSEQAKDEEQKERCKKLCKKESRLLAI
jgi:hypothetical protein